MTTNRRFRTTLKWAERQFLGSVYCTFTALICKSLIINGAGEGNRTLVSAHFDVVGVQ